MNIDKNNASAYYSMNMLKMLLGMKLITEEEYEEILRSISEHYETELYCV